MVKLPAIFNSPNKTPAFLTIDIGSEEVKCFAFEVFEDSANIIGIGKEPLEAGSTRGGVIVDFDSVYETVEAALMEAIGELGIKIKDAIFGVSGDLSFGLMTTVRLTRGLNEPVSEKEMDGIYDKIYEAAYNQALNDMMDRTGNVDMEIEMVTSSVVYIELDGRKMEDPIGGTGQKMEVALFTAFAPTFHTKALQKVAKKLRLNIVALGSGMYSLVKSMEASKGKKFDGVIMDIGGDITDVGVIFSGGIVATRSLNLGGRHLTRQISEEMKLTLVDAENKKREYSFGRFSDEENLEVQDSMYDVLNLWLSGIELLFMDFTGVKTFPSQFYLVGGGAELPDIIESIKKEPWTRSIPFKSPPEFNKLTLGDLPLVSDSTGGANSLSDILPASLSIVYLELNGYLNG